MNGIVLTYCSYQTKTQTITLEDFLIRWKLDRKETRH